MDRKRVRYHDPDTVDESRYYGRSRQLFSGDWQAWLSLAILRAVAAAGFSAIDSVEDRFGDAALIVICLILAGLAGLVAAADWYTRETSIRPELAADIVTLVVLIPTVAVAGNVQVADGRFGGRLPNVLAAIGAVLLGLVIVALVAQIDPRSRSASWSAGTIPAALTVAAIIGGAGYFSTQRLGEGLALAWLAAAVSTLLIGVTPRNYRPLLLSLVYIAFALGILILSAGETDAPNINTSAEGLSYLTLVLAGLVVFLQSIHVFSRRT